MRWPALIKGLLIKRYKRFLMDVTLENGEVITAHCPNTGAMTGCAEPGNRVWLSTSDNPKRKYRHTWELTQTAAGYWIGIHSAKANALVKEALENDIIKELQNYSQIRTEVKYGEKNSRIDLLLANETGQLCFVEVKSVTLLADKKSGLGVFPDAVSKRGLKHLTELMLVKAQGHRAVLLFCVQHSGISSVAPADTIDRLYGEAFRAAIKAGVEVLAYRADIDASQILLAKRLPISMRQPVK